LERQQIFSDFIFEDAEKGFCLFILNLHWYKLHCLATCVLFGMDIGKGNNFAMMYLSFPKVFQVINQIIYGFYFLKVERNVFCVCKTGVLKSVFINHITMQL